MPQQYRAIEHGKKINVALWAFVMLAWPAFSQADTIYLCKAYAGGMFWTNGTCSAKSALIERIANVPSGMPFSQQVEIAQAQKSDAANVSQTITTTTTTTNTSQPSPKSMCDSLSAQISSYDSMARQPQSAQVQDWITSERKKVRDRQFSLRC